VKNIAIFASGKGSNFIAIHEAIQSGLLDANICLFVTDRKKSEALIKAKELQIKTYSFSISDFGKKEDYEREIVSQLEETKTDLVVLAGYMRIIGQTILSRYPNKIVNIHPSLLPLYKGKDAIGQVLRAGEIKTGVTVHFVDEGIDTGQLILQKEVKIDSLEHRESLEKKVHKVEHEIYYKAIKKILED